LEEIDLFVFFGRTGLNPFAMKGRHEDFHEVEVAVLEATRRRRPDSKACDERSVRRSGGRNATAPDALLAAGLTCLFAQWRQRVETRTCNGPEVWWRRRP
jgi:hypothetical protein